MHHSFPYRFGERVTVRWVDLKSEYVQIVDKEGNTYEVHISKLEAVTDDLDMSEDEILKREE